MTVDASAGLNLSLRGHALGDIASLSMQSEKLQVPPAATVVYWSPVADKPLAMLDSATAGNAS